MNCLIALCSLFTAPNFYFAASTDIAVNGNYVTGKHSQGYWCGEHWCRGPLMDVRLGFQGAVSDTIELDLGVRHTSFAMEDDRGRESVYVSLTWRPFR